MDGAAFQGMPRIALTPAEEALIPRPHSSASQVATAVPSTYSRHSTSPGTPRHQHHPNHHSSLAYHPYYANSSAANSTLAGLHQSPSSASIPLSADQYSRPASPSPHLQQQQQQQSSLSIYSLAGASTSSTTGGGGLGAIAPTTPASGSVQEYPQNPQDGYYSQVPPRPSSPGPPRLAFSLTPRPARSPSPQLYSNLHDQNYQPRSSYFSRGSYDAQPRPGSPLQQEHQESWDSSVRMESPAQMTDSEEDTDSDDEAEEDSKQRRKRRPEPSKRASSKSILRRLKESTSRMSFGDDTSASASQRPYRTSQESDRAQRNSRDSSSTSLPGKEVLQDLSDEERQQEPRKSRSAWRPSLSLIRQESDGSGMNSYLQNDPNRISGQPSNGGTGPRRSSSNNRIPNNNNNSSLGAENKQKKSSRTSNGKKKKRASKKRKAKEAAARHLQQQQLHQQQLAKQEDLSLPTLFQVLEKKTRYPLSYDDFEAFLRSRRAVEYLNFWTDVTAHEQLCRTFDVSERRQKRELQLEERAIARDRRRMALLTAVESGKLGGDTDFLTPGHASIGAGTGIGIGASGQEIDGSNLYLASRSSLQLPLNDHLSFPQENRRYGLHDSSAPFPPPPSNLHGSNHGSGAYNRLLSGIGGRRVSGERSRPSLEEEHISEQDAAVAAVVALKGQQKTGEQYDYNNASREDIRRGSFDFYRPMPTHGSSHLRYQQNNNSSGYVGGGTIPSTHSSPNAYNLMMRGRGSVDMMPRSNSRSSRVRPSASEDYFGNGIRRTTSQQFQNQQHPSLSNEAEEGSGAGQAFEVGESNIDHMLSPLGPRRQMSHQSLSIQEPDWNRRPSVVRTSGGVGPLQAPVSIRRSGESAYAPSIFSNGEGKALLVQSFRTISLEDLQESALRIYRKYLIQLRTAPMAAEEEAAASSMKASNEAHRNLNRASLDKTMAPGWDGYAEEIIAQWNENWKGRRANRLSGRRSFASRGGLGVTSGQAINVDDDPRTEKDGSSSPARLNLTVQTDDFEAGDEEVEEQQAKDLSTNPKSPISPRFKKRAGTGLSSVLPPFLSRILRTEVTVVELPTLTINTTTVEETAVPEESEEDDEDDEDDDEEDYDSDAEDETDDEENEVKLDTSFTTAKSSEKSSEKPSETSFEVEVHRKDSANPIVQEKVTSIVAHNVGEEEVVILDRSVPIATPLLNNNNAIGTAAGETPTVITFQDQLAGDDVGSGEAKTPSSRHRRHSSASSLSSSWDKISKRDLEKSVSILPSPVTASLRSSPYKRGGVRGIRARTTGRAANMASRTVQKVGWQLSTLMNQSLRKKSSSDSLDIIRVTPVTSPRIGGRDFRFQIPDIVMNNSSSPVQIHNQAQHEDRHGNEAGTNGPHSTELYPEGHPLTLIPTNNTDNGQQDNESHGKDLSLFSTHRHKSLGSALQLPKSFLTPATSSVTNPTMSNSSSSSSPTQSNAVIGGGGAPPLFTGPPSATVASSAAAAAFYLPLECRQRIHTQVQEEGRTEAPYLYGPAKGFVLDVVLQDHYYPLFLEYVEQQNLGLLNQGHPNNQVKRRGAIWIGILTWVAVFGLQLMLVLMNKGGWKSPWVWVLGVVGGWPGSIFLATGIKGFSPVLGILGRMSEDKHILRTRKILEPSIRVRHQLRAYWMLSYCIFWSTLVMVVFAALPQRVSSRT